MRRKPLPIRTKFCTPAQVKGRQRLYSPHHSLVSSDGRN